MDTEEMRIQHILDFLQVNHSRNMYAVMSELFDYGYTKEEITKAFRRWLEIVE